MALNTMDVPNLFRWCDLRIIFRIQYLRIFTEALYTMPEHTYIYNTSTIDASITGKPIESNKK